MNKSLLLSALKGLGVGIAITLILLLIGNLIALKTPDPDTTASFLAHGIRILAGFATGFFAARFRREQGLVTGVVAGVLYTALLALGAAFIAGAFSFFSSLLLCLAVVASAAIGGILGIPGEKSSAAKRKALLKRIGEK